MKNIEAWLSNAEKFGTKYWRLEKKNGVELYVTQSEYTDGRNFFYRSPVYHVWKDDEHVTSTLNMKDAYACYERLACTASDTV